MSSVRAFVAAAAALILTSCVHVQNGGKADLSEQGQKLAAGDSQVLSDADARVSELGAAFPNPGTYQTVEVKNADGTVLEALQARGEPGEFGGALMMSTFGQGPKTFNAWQASDAESDGIGLIQFEQLVGLDAWTGKYYPRLAKSMTISPDGRVYTFTLRKGLQWSDGHKLTADDVMFTFVDLIGGGFGNTSRRDVLMVDGKFPKFEKLDGLTVRVTTQKPFAPLLDGLRVAIAPKHVLAPWLKRPRGDFAQLWNINCKPETLVTSGPFKLKRSNAERVELVRNPNYFMVDKKGARLPYLDRFVVLVVPNQQAQSIKFYAGEIDLLDIRQVRGFDVALMKQRERHGDFVMHQLGPDDATVFLMFNMCQRKDPKTKKFYVDPVKQKWFNSKRFRWAVSRAINRQRIVNNAMKGVGKPLYTCETPACLYFNSNLPGFEQDLDAARKLLQEDGFVLKDKILYDKDGHRVEFNLLTNSGNTTRDGICISIKNDLDELGMKVNYTPIEFNVLIDKTETSLDWDAVVMGLTGSRTEPYGGANVWKADGRLHMFDQRLPDAAGNVPVTDARPWETRIGKLFDLGATTLDPVERKKYYDEYQKIAYEEQPFIYIECPLLFTAAQKSLANYKPLPLGINYPPLGSMHNLEELYFRSAHRRADRQAK